MGGKYLWQKHLHFPNRGSLLSHLASLVYCSTIIAASDAATLATTKRLQNLSTSPPSTAAAAYPALSLTLPGFYSSASLKPARPSIYGSHSDYPVAGAQSSQRGRTLETAGTVRGVD